MKLIYKISKKQLRDNILIDLPASKSLSNRALILKGLCESDNSNEGDCELSHISDCDDTKVMLAAHSKDMDSYVFDGDYRIVDIGAAGTSMRFLTAYFAAQEGAKVIMTGSERMRQRPISVLVDALRKLGADVEYVDNEGFPPLRINGKKLEGGKLEIDGSISSQYISALLMIAPTLQQGLELHLLGNVTSVPYIRMTLSMMQEFGVSSAFDDCIIKISPSHYKNIPYSVESDWSAASYWYEVLATTPKLHSIRLKGLRLDSTQGDMHVADYFRELGIDTEPCAEGVLIKRSNRPLPEQVEWDMSSQPDLAQTMICTLCWLGVPFDIKGLHTLRIKETDRIAALENELANLGYIVEDSDNDRMYWDGYTAIDDEVAIQLAETQTFGPIATYKDHRMAMAFAPLCNEACSIKINEPEVVSKSYPSFWNDMKAIGYIINKVK